MQNFDPKVNYLESRQAIGYVNKNQATQEDYDRIGFKSGLEVHQQLLTSEKLFCRCPAGKYNKSDDFDAEVIRSMRPTLSELGEYDGTALMEFKTKKEIVYRIKNETACTYEIDDTPPFPVNREALGIAIEISLLCKLNIVGEVHITRKQYLDGSIPTGFQRTAIIGVEGEIPLKNKKVRLIQLSLEEDSCREISDIGHKRVYKTDRLGMPLIETVTYPECLNPEEVKEACDYIRFLNRSTGKVRVGIGAARQDVNVSCRGGARVEIKGVSHTKWIPKLTHIEAFRQWALLRIRDMLRGRGLSANTWNITSRQIDIRQFQQKYDIFELATKRNDKIFIVKLNGMKGILSHFTQPGKMFADEISDRLKVIACLEKPNMFHSEMFESVLSEADNNLICKELQISVNDAYIVFWGPDEDIKTGLETIEERLKLSFLGVPNETRKSFQDGTTIFERVLPGADRMYPDTDSAPIPLNNNEIERIGSMLPLSIIERYNMLKEWNIPEDNYTYIFKKNLFGLIQKMVNELSISPRRIGTFFGQVMKYVEGHYTKSDTFTMEKVLDIFNFLEKNNLKYDLASEILPIIYEHPNLDFDSVLVILKFKKVKEEEILLRIGFLAEKYLTIKKNENFSAEVNWIMGQLRKIALGNIDLPLLRNEIESIVNKKNIN